MTTEIVRTSLRKGLHRVVGAGGKLIRDEAGNPIDRGGYGTERAAKRIATLFARTGSTNPRVKRASTATSRGPEGGR